jgi:hypothetical protein
LLSKELIVLTEINCPKLKRHKIRRIVATSVALALVVPNFSLAQTTTSGPEPRGIEVEVDARQSECAPKYANAPVIGRDFDRQLGRLLSGTPRTQGAAVAINPVAPFMRDATPPALVTWLEAVAKTGGSVKIEALECGNERFSLGGLRDFFAGLDFLADILGAIRAYRYERQVRDFNVVLYQNPINLKIVQIAFVRR